MREDVRAKVVDSRVSKMLNNRSYRFAVALVNEATDERHSSFVNNPWADPGRLARDAILEAHFLWSRVCKNETFTLALCRCHARQSLSRTWNMPSRTCARPRTRARKLSASLNYS